MKLALCVILFTAYIQDTSNQQHTVLIHNGFLKAREFTEMTEGTKRAYVMGLMDGMYLAPYFGAPEKAEPLVSIATCVESMKSSQVAAIIEKYIRDHPENWHRDLKDEGYQAMRHACLK